MTDRSRLRLVVLGAVVVSLLATLLGRLWYVQVLAGPQYRQEAADNNVRDIVTPAPRGLILDDVGRTLVGNQDALEVTVDRTRLEKLPDSGHAVLTRLAGMLGMTWTEISRKLLPCGPKVGQPCWNGSPYEPVPVSTHVSPTTAFTILENKARFPAIDVQPVAIRAYPQWTRNHVSAAHLLGYLGPITVQELGKLPYPQRAANINDQVGRSGLEEAYNSYLAGIPGLDEVTVDHRGRVTGVLHNTLPTPGDSLVTSIDAGVQQDLEKALVAAVDNSRATARSAGGNAGGPPQTAAGVVLDARTGRVVALASYPSYAPNAFVGGISAAGYQTLTSSSAGFPLFDKAIEGEFLPGSTFKLITASAALASGEASPYGGYDCPPSVVFHGASFGNFESESAGTISLHDALVMSCDTVFYSFGEQQYAQDQQLIAAHQRPQEVVAHMAMDYGLGHSTGIDLAGEASGAILDREGLYRYWKYVDVPNACKGARNPAFTPQRRAYDQSLCLYGGIFEPGDQLLLDIGQGGSVDVTPLQMAVAYAALVNGGTVWSPRVGAAIISSSGHVVRRINPVVRGHIPLSTDLRSYIEQALYNVPTQTSPVRGTATAAFNGFPQGKVQVGGKTGTADVCPTQSCVNAPNAWFDSFAGRPGSPELVSAIVVTNGGQGGVVSAPATRGLWDGVFGLEGRAGHADFPSFAPPTGLPRFAPDGTVIAVPPLPRRAPAAALGALVAEPALRFGLTKGRG